MSNNDSTTTAGIGVGGLCLLWGIVTQCLNWAGVISWPWYAIWGPILLDLAFVAVVFVLVLLACVGAEIIERINKK